MSRYIDADALIEELERCSYDTWSKGVNRAWWAQAVMVKDNIVECIKRQPIADVVEVVRCKDCEYWHKICFDPFCEHWDGECLHHKIEVMFENDFCSFGERREG